MKETIKEYIIKVWNSEHNQYVSFGDHYNSKEECLSVFKRVVETYLKLSEKSDFWKQEYNDYTSKEYPPMLIIDTMVIDYKPTQTEQIIF